MKQTFSILITITVLICFIFICMSAGCTGTGEEIEKNGTQISPTSRITLVEFYHFHGNQQCYSCKKLGEMAEDLVKTYYPDELASGKLVFGHINYQDPGNTELIQKYEVSTSSLMIGVHTSNSFAKADIVQAWYYISDKEKFETVLRDIFDPLLKGEQS